MRELPGSSAVVSMGTFALNSFSYFTVVEKIIWITEVYIVQLEQSS